MRSIHNAVLDTVEELRLSESGVDHSITNDRNNTERWIIRFTSKPGSLVFFLLEIEIMENEGNPAGLVLHRINLSNNSMNRVMNRLMERLHVPRLVLPLHVRRPQGGSQGREY